MRVVIMLNYTGIVCLHECIACNYQHHCNLVDRPPGLLQPGKEWAVFIFRPVEDVYEYTWQSKNRTGTNFVVTLHT